MKKTIILVAVFTLFAKHLFAQTVTPEQYVAQYKDLAIREMKRMGVPAAITLAQGLLETEDGNSDLLKSSNNHFGIKCKDTWTSGGVSHDDDAQGECFRKYKSAEDSYRDHSNFLRGSGRYAFLFQLDPLDYKGWAYGLKKAGYATNPKYPEILINNIEQYHLQQYSLMAANDVPAYNPGQYKDDPETSVESDPSDLAFNKTGASIDKTTTINGSKCLYANKGVALLAIATKYNINLDKLLQFNDLTKDGILQKNQVIYLEKKPEKGENDFHVLKPGETLYDVAQDNGIQLASLLAYNSLSADSIVAPGTELYLKPVNEIDPTQQTQTASGNPQYHSVEPKEGLYSIAKKYNVTVGQLKQWNNLSGDDLHVGQQLIIYQ